MKTIRGSAVYVEGHVVAYYDEARYTVPEVLADLQARGSGWTLMALTLWCEGVCIHRHALNRRPSTPGG